MFIVSRWTIDGYEPFLCTIAARHVRATLCFAFPLASGIVRLTEPPFAGGRAF